MIVGIAGTLGSGKTCMLTRYAYLAYEQGRRIISNYHLNFDHEYLNIKDLFEKREQLHNCFLAIDEMQVFLDCRLSASKQNRLFSYFILQTRKRNVDLYFTTQDISMIDLRLLRHLSIYIKMSNIYYRDEGGNIQKHPYLFFAEFHDYRDPDNISTQVKIFDGRK